ncbi:MAG: PAS domain-containing protein, partial [Planctomycetota bacterium]
MSDLQQAEPGPGRSAESDFKSHGFNRAILESLSFGVALQDIESGAFLDCNTAGLKLLGVDSLDEVCGRLPADFSPGYQTDGGDSRTLAEQRLREVTETGSSRFEWTLQRHNGEQFTVEVTLSRV